MTTTRANGRHHRCGVRTRIEDLATHEEPNVRVGELAQYWGVRVETVRKWIRFGKLPAVLVGRSLRVKRDDAAAFERKWKPVC